MPKPRNRILAIHLLELTNCFLFRQIMAVMNIGEKKGIHNTPEIKCSTYRRWIWNNRIVTKAVLGMMFGFDFCP